MRLEAFSSLWMNASILLPHDGQWLTNYRQFTDVPIHEVHPPAGIHKQTARLNYRRYKRERSTNNTCTKINWEKYTVLLFRRVVKYSEFLSYIDFWGQLSDNLQSCHHSHVLGICHQYTLKRYSDIYRNRAKRVYGATVVFLDYDWSISCFMCMHIKHVPTVNSANVAQKRLHFPYRPLRLSRYIGWDTVFKVSQWIPAIYPQKVMWMGP